MTFSKKLFFLSLLFFVSNSFSQSTDFTKLFGLSKESKAIQDELESGYTAKNEAGTNWFENKGAGKAIKFSTDGNVTNINIHSRLNKRKKDAGWNIFKGDLPFMLESENVKEKALISSLEKQEGITAVAKKVEAIEFTYTSTNTEGTATTINVKLITAPTFEKGRIMVLEIQMSLA